MARDFLTIATDGVGVERLFNTSRDVCHYRRSRLHPDTIEAIMLQICTDRFTINEEYKDIIEEMNPEDIQFTLPDDDNDEEDITATIYISDIEDLDDLEDDFEEDEYNTLPAAIDYTRTQEDMGPSQVSRNLRRHERRPGQYKE
jgi:hypothetical protein